MKIWKSKDIRIKLTLFATLGVIISIIYCFFLGYLNTDFDGIKELFIPVGIIVVVLIVLMWVICILLIKFDKQYYLIDQESIRLFKKDELIFELNKNEFFQMYYIRYFWTFLFQMGSGYLNFKYMYRNENDKKFASLVFPDGIIIHSISMSLKQAKAVAKILGNHLEIK